MWGVAQIKYSNENSWSRGVVSLHTHGWVHLITYPREVSGDDMVMMSYPESKVEHVEWLEVRLTAFDGDGNGLRAAKAMLDKYRHALYPDAEGAPMATAVDGAPAAPAVAE
ncbi:MAG: hypothetical protein JWM80_4097 [Cyanobacteria bacterium RYN_339]|nr:hypothetical protein [Cyanobacteria bacterium RYN_339]